MVSRFDVKTEADVIAYMIDCNLATVSDLAWKRTKSQKEYARQKRIASQCIEWAQQLGVDLSTTRAHDVINKANGNVCIWAAQFEEKQ